MGIDRIHDFGRNFGLGDRTGIDIPSERRGIWPSREWKKRARRVPWFPGDSLNVGIGQGFVLTTPLQLATMTATLASRGHFRRPQLVHHVSNQPVAGESTDPEESLELDALNDLKSQPEAAAPVAEAAFVEVSDEHWNSVFKAMEAVVHSPRGTAQTIRYGLKYRMAGKTGTAQVVGIAQGEEYDSEALAERQRDHALFVAFAPIEDPQIAVAVIVDNGEKSSTSAKVARKVIDYYLDAEAAKAEVSSIVGVLP
jgi:penicillin-binding protein 2